MCYRHLVEAPGEGDLYLRVGNMGVLRMLIACLQKQLVAVVEGAGFEGSIVSRGAVADSDSAILRVSGMTCSSCSSAIETALLGHNGVQVCGSTLQRPALLPGIQHCQTTACIPAITEGGCRPQHGGMRLAVSAVIGHCQHLPLHSTATVHNHPLPSIAASNLMLRPLFCCAESSSQPPGRQG